MAVTIRQVETKKDLKVFVKIPFSIYPRGSLWIPPLIRDDMETFDRNRNPAYENAETRLFIAYRDGQPVGRIAAINSLIAQKKYNLKNLRFGWFETVEDYQVAETLLQALEGWARELGMDTITGPQGFCDLDPQGMMVEGYDELPTIAGYYNLPYYPRFMERYGFRKEIDYVEFQTQVPHETGIPEKLVRLAERVKERGGFRVLKFKSKKEMISRGADLFHLLDEAFEEIYGSVPLSERQIIYYIKKYLPFVHKDLIKLVVSNQNEVIGFMITMPSLSKAFQKARGRLFPLGWFWLLRALKTRDILDFYLAGIKKSFRGLGVDLLMVIDITQTALRMGFCCAESNQELETNTKVQAQWKYFNPRQHKRKRIYKKEVGR